MNKESSKYQVHTEVKILINEHRTSEALKNKIREKICHYVKTGWSFDNISSGGLFIYLKFSKYRKGAILSTDALWRNENSNGPSAWIATVLAYEGFVCEGKK